MPASSNRTSFGPHQGHGLRRRAGRQAQQGAGAFNLDNLRFNKIVICTDADVDGYQIRTLVLTMLYRLTPTLINEGYVYIAESPLYEINTEDKTYLRIPSRKRPLFCEKIGTKNTPSSAPKVWARTTPR